MSISSTSSLQQLDIHEDIDQSQSEIIILSFDNDKIKK